MKLEGETALVTGATRGIGQAIARELAAEGARVIGTATSDTGAQSITQDLEPLAAETRGTVLDVASRHSIDRLMSEMNAEWGPPSILVNNAGITHDSLLMRMDDEAWDTIIETNLTSVYRLSKACLRPMMKARHGRIINLSSVVGITGNAGQSNYAAAKAGIIGFTRSLAREVGARGITVNVVAPGFIDTDMTRDLPEDQRDGLLGHIPLQRLGAPDDIAKAVTFLASPAASYITGETLNVNGGMHMGC